MWILVVIFVVILTKKKNLKNKKSGSQDALSSPSPTTAVSQCIVHSKSAQTFLLPFSVMVNNSPILHFLKINDRRKGGNGNYRKIPKACGSGWMHRLWRKHIWLQIVAPPRTGSRSFRKTMKRKGSQQPGIVERHRSAGVIQACSEGHFGWVERSFKIIFLPLFPG